MILPNTIREEDTENRTGGLVAGLATIFPMVDIINLLRKHTHMTSTLSGRGREGVPKKKNTTEVD